MYQAEQALFNEDELLSAIKIGAEFDGQANVLSACLDRLQAWLTDARRGLPEGRTDRIAFERFIRFFYVDLAFSDEKTSQTQDRYFLLHEVIGYRTGNPLNLALIFRFMANQLGFRVEGINFPGHFLLCAEFTSAQRLYLDPCSGQSLSMPDLHSLYCAMVGESSTVSLPSEVLQPASRDDILLRLLQNIKGSFIRNQQFHLALLAADRLVRLSPMDPYERRDRGLLLHQLECTQVALPDFQFFIDQCPDDPSSALLAAQVRQLHNSPHNVFH